jgi:hypothetical protein
MKADALIRDPVFQLNLLLWMAKEQPPGDYRVRPFFFELGFNIIYIEQPFPLPEETSRRAVGSALAISTAPEPELILGHASNGKALYFEAKANSFAPESSTSKQARGHFLATGPAFQEVFPPLTSCLLCYVVPEDNRALMQECLTHLLSELSAAELESGLFSCQGLLVSESRMIYVWDLVFKEYLDLNEDSAIIFADVEDDTDPSPLLLVFSEEDCPNEEVRDFYRRALIEQVRARMLCDLQTLPLNRDYEISVDELLLETSDGIFEYLGRERQKRLRLLIRENLFRRICDYWVDRPQDIHLEHSQLKIRWQSATERDAFLGWFEDRRVKFDANRPVERRMPLLDGLPEQVPGETKID